MTWTSNNGLQKTYMNWEQKGSYPFTVLFYSNIYGSLKSVWWKNAGQVNSPFYIL